MDVLLAGNEPSLWKGPLPALNVQRHYLWKSFRTKSNTIPGLAEKCSASARNPVRLHPGIVFDINPERCSASPRNPVRLGPESPHKYRALCPATESGVHWLLTFLLPKAPLI